MSATTKQPKRNLTSLELSDEARERLDRIKEKFGVIKTRAIERGLVLLEASLTKATK